MVRCWSVALLIALLVSLTPALARQDVVPKGDRRLGIDVNEAEGEEYDAAFALAVELGMDEVGLSLDWIDLEPAPGQFDGTWLEIANIYYPAWGMPLTLTLRPIHTGTLRVPDDLRDLPLDDPTMIARFEALLDFVFATMPDVTFSSLVIGSEFDAYLGNDAARWVQYTNFAQQTADYARSQRPGLQVAFEAMYEAFTGPASQHLGALNAHAADIIGVSYYPLEDDFAVQSPKVVAEAFATVAGAYPDKPIYFYQFGYPSSDLLGSSEAQQAAFIREAFAAWDAHADHIKMIAFTWLSEQSSETVAGFEDYYGYSDERFAAFLGSLGLRYRDGTPKAALDALREEAAARGW